MGTIADNQIVLELFKGGASVLQAIRKADHLEARPQPFAGEANQQTINDIFENLPAAGNWVYFGFSFGSVGNLNLNNYTASAFMRQTPSTYESGQVFNIKFKEDHQVALDTDSLYKLEIGYGLTGHI